ncbi:hypothetical protein FRC08_009261 [Ceratobasidium sp. 394]|nr:hypothetical protein FRC08_009261 [Ceratobasidium sp. 394]
MSKQSKGKAVKRKQVRSSSEEGSRSGRESNQSGEDDQQGSLRDAQMRALKAERLTENQDQQIRALQAKLKEYAARTSKKQKRAAAGGGGPSNRRSETPVDQHADPPNQRPVNANQQAPPAPVQPNAKLLDDDYNRVLVRMAGRRCCVLHNPFLEPDFLTDNTVQQALPQIIKDLESKIAGGSEAGSDAEGGDHPGGDEDFWATLRFELAQPVDIVREILSTLPIELGRLWLNPRFQKLFHTGYRKMKSEAVSGVANARLVVFKMTEEEFGQRSDDRKRGAAAQALF